MSVANRCSAILRLEDGRSSAMVDRVLEEHQLAPWSDVLSAVGLVTERRLIGGWPTGQALALVGGSRRRSWPPLHSLPAERKAAARHPD
jgi:hypothetical protein